MQTIWQKKGGLKLFSRTTPSNVASILPRPLKSQLQLAQFLLLTLVVKLLQSSKQAKLESLAANLPIPILFESRRRKLQRFLGIRALPQKNPGTS